LRDLELRFEQAAFVGDDLPDLSAMVKAGLAIAVADAHPEVRRHAHWTTELAGGRGAAREVSDLILDAQGLLAAQHARYRGE
jgi:3-deoxy-D-manno-octulosonate 8-phosphate phosphatase (KDO 8-P phosphatase)